MSLGEIEPIPEGFLAKLLDAFGIQWTHLVIISGIVFSSFGLQKYLNSGVWILGTVSAFSLSYLFRFQLSGNFVKTFLLALLGALVALITPILVIHFAHQQLLALIEGWSKLATLYLSVAIGVPLGLIILSYKKQEALQLTSFPPNLANALHAVTESVFVHERVTYELSLASSGKDSVSMHFNVEMNLFNRSRHKQKYVDIFGSPSQRTSFEYAEINNVPVNIDDPERLSLRGLTLTHSATGEEHFRVKVAAQSLYHERDSEFVGVYLPCSVLSIRILKSSAAAINVHVESLLQEKVDAKRMTNGDLFFEYEKGILPFQGVRVSWYPNSVKNQREI